jgi:hypothetical protein
MDWDCELLVTNSNPVILPCAFTSQLLAIEVISANQRNTWFNAGYLQAFAVWESRRFIGKKFRLGFGEQLIEIPYLNYELEYQAQPYFENTLIRIQQLSTIQANQLIIEMGINIAPATPEQLGDETVTTVNANVANVVLDPANPNRREGFIVNKSNRNLWVRFAATAATAAAPTSMVPPNSNINIPDGYTGVINGIWSGPAPTNNAEIHQFNVV